MHLTGGQFKGRVITNPKGGRIEVKPTLSKVRMGVFNALFSHFGDFTELSFLDMFTGSGIIAAEAYSRGFNPVFAIEFDPKTYAQTTSLMKNAGFDFSVLKGNSLKIIEKLPEFDVIYIDPPWDFDYSEIFSSAFKHLKTGGILVTESDKKKVKAPCLFNGTEILPFKEKIYGRCMISFYLK